MDPAGADPIPAPVERADTGAARRFTPLRHHRAADQPPIHTLRAALVGAAAQALAGRPFPPP